MSKIPIALSWSGGKDCSYALHLIQQEGKYEVKYLLSTCNTHTRELNMHHLHETLITAQAAAIGIPLMLSHVAGTSNAQYEAALQSSIQQLQQQGIYAIAFGDIFLEDIRQYREQLMTQLGMQVVFPLWQLPTNHLLQSMIKSGFKAMICCIDAQRIPTQWLGKILDDKSMATLPQDIDPCGENGEFHTFCVDGPVFQYPLHIKTGAISSQRMTIAANRFAIFSWVHIHLLPQP